ncbi:uncharacterized protein LOC117651723 [Thrips palmi]|uniref:Uncharacterized protein LOC117651723 n=1 Tax=Thrips palmi TaxID=161013 RepID=A0A6P9A294_THRPL|nr:uncharacterized protein LOC117651723 [Thrips palmi]
METLPNEMVLEVFSRISDGVTLLDGVGLVCKRWHALSRDPHAWRSVVVEFGDYDWVWQGAKRSRRKKKTMDNVRVLLHAPAMCRLSWSWGYGGPVILKPHAIALSAVRRCRAAIRDVVLEGVSKMAKPALAVLCGLLWHTRGHLTHLTIREYIGRRLEKDEAPEAGVSVDVEEECALSPEQEQSDAVAAWAEQDGYDSWSLPGVLAQLHRLEDLSLDLCWEFPYDDELQVEGELLPALRYLRLKYDFPIDLAVDLIRGTAARLRHLSLPDEYWEAKFAMSLFDDVSGLPSLPSEVIDSVAECLQLRSLAANLMHVTCVFNMRRLRSLHLWLSGQEVRSEDAVATAQLLARHGESLSGLRRLDLELGSGATGDSLDDPPLWEGARTSVAELLLAVAHAAHNVTELRLTLDWNFEDLIDKILGCLPRLQEVHLHWFGQDDHVDALSALPDLRSVTGWTKLTGVKADLIMTNLKMARPDLKLSIKQSEF